MSKVLLIGAGFSRNWGGWLAAEAFEYLIGSDHLDVDLRGLLWEYRRSGGFEGALGEVQEAFSKNNSPDNLRRLTSFQRAVQHMFSDMNRAFDRIQFEFQNDSSERQVLTFLARFDSIFTLNQDLLLEGKYLTDNIVLRGGNKWPDGWQLPGTVPRAQPNDFYGQPVIDKRVPASQPFQTSPRRQPIYKLHGSSNWTSETDQQLLVLGGNKTAIIKDFPLLKWYHEQFEAQLAAQDTKLMVIGYSFSDDHINQVLMRAAENASFRLFIVDPLGVDILDKNRGATIYSAHPLIERLGPRIVGASRRQLSEIFGRDQVEHAKIMRFF